MKTTKEIFIIQDKFIEDSIRSNAIPPIKGDITKGKLKWRGINLVIHKSMLWVEQRGIPISLTFDTDSLTTNNK